MTEYFTVFVVQWRWHTGSGWLRLGLWPPDRLARWQDLVKLLEQHDAVRALRMASYGFLLYGPFSQLWYQFLERHLPGAAAKNLALKVGCLDHAAPGKQHLQGASL